MTGLYPWGTHRASLGQRLQPESLKAVLSVSSAPPRGKAAPRNPQ